MSSPADTLPHRRLLFVGGTEEERLNARALERDFWEVVQRETRITRLIAVAACLVMYAVGYASWSSTEYLCGTVGAAAAFLTLLFLPRWANLLMAAFVLPAGAGERSARCCVRDGDLRACHIVH